VPLARGREMRGVVGVGMACYLLATNALDWLLELVVGGMYVLG
jgi:hypothetical protein